MFISSILTVRNRAGGAVKCGLSVRILIMAGMLMSAFAQDEVTEEDQRTFLALQKPEINAIGQQWVEVDFLTGPNLVEYQYAVGCYNATDNVDCGDILSGGAESIDSVSGLLPRKYSRVEANLTIPDNTEVDCFVTVGGGPLDLISKCQLAGVGTTDPLPIPEDFRVAVSSVPGRPDALLVKAEPGSIGRNSPLESMLSEPAVSSSRSYVVAYKAQCLPAPATTCDLSQPLVNADTVFTNGTIVPDLIPNTDYECFVIATYDGEAQCTSGDKTDVVPTLPNPPTNVSVSNPTIDSLDVAAIAPEDPVGGGAVPLAGYAFQCSTGLECDSNGTWFPVDDFVDDPTTPVTVSGLTFGTEYNCWAATVSGSSGSYQYSCSDYTPPPTAPTSPVAAATSNCSPSIDVSWNTPSGSSAITEFAVSCASPGTSAVTTAVDATVTNATLSVEAGKSYTCSITSVGPGGSSAAAVASPATYIYSGACFSLCGVSEANPLYSQNFSENADGWVEYEGGAVTWLDDFSPPFNGVSGVGQVNTSGPFTRWRAADSDPVDIIMDDVPSGIIVQLAYYLDVSDSNGLTNDQRVDYSVALTDNSENKEGDGFIRDYMFNYGFYDDDGGPGSGERRFIVSTSNNSPGWPKNPDKDPIAITQSGWYIFRHKFYPQEGGDGVFVELSIFDSDCGLVKSWDPQQVTVSSDNNRPLAGSEPFYVRYGWIITNQLPLDSLKVAGQVYAEVISNEA